MHSKNLITTLISKSDLKDLKEYVALLYQQQGRFYLRNDLLMLFRQYCDEQKKTKRFREASSMLGFIKRIQELFIQERFVVILHRYDIAKYNFYLLRRDAEHVEAIDIVNYLTLKDRYVLKRAHNGQPKIDYLPFHDYAPSMKDPKNIGNGIRFLNRYLCSQIFSNPQRWNQRLFEFIQLHSHNGQPLLVNSKLLKDFEAFYQALQKMVAELKQRKAAIPYAKVAARMRRAGFEAGWGNQVGRIVETMQLLMDLIHEPEATLLGKFISRVPMPLVSKVAIISPHGWFGQSEVLGLPDTGGQVIYILDQVRALERHLKEESRLAGLEVTPQIVVVTRLIPNAAGTTCNQRLEKIFETENGWILRVPFKDAQGHVLPDWISRFRVWPYLEKFADDAATELLSQFEGRPDLIIGNYSDGNLVATLLSDKLNVIQCTIAHALEKTKYLFSDLFWNEREAEYNFSLQFIADILAMNKSDFIITSTFQEIFGTEDSMGQYESYQFFTLPGLYQVTSGVHLYSPKFNVIRPGVEEQLYFPYHAKEKRIAQQTRRWQQRLFHSNEVDIFGHLDDPAKPPIFTMARFDKIKNITGLIEAFGLSSELQQHCNLIFAAGTIDVEQSHDHEEQAEIRKAYELIERYRLHGKVRWLPSIEKLETGEVYRIVADQRGMFVQPALFEAFGLTIIEAMATGLPTFGPKFGGPQEIIEYGVSGFLMNTSRPELIAPSLEEFVRNCQKDLQYWQRISENGIRRVQEHFTWRLYSDTLVYLTKLYGFWRYAVSGQARVKMDRYSDFIYHFLFRERARQLTF